MDGELQSHLVMLFHIFAFTPWSLEWTDLLIGFRCEKRFFLKMASGWRSGAWRGVSTGVHLCFFVYKQMYPNIFVASSHLLELYNSGAILYTSGLIM